MNVDETLLDLAKRNMEIANILYAHKETDDGFLNHVGYHLQQCVELALKHFLETHGIEYSFTHDIASARRWTRLAKPCYREWSMVEAEGSPIPNVMRIFVL